MKTRGFVAAAAMVWSLPGFAQLEAEPPTLEDATGVAPLVSQDTPNVATELKSEPVQGVTQDVSRVADELKAPAADAGQSPRPVGSTDQVKRDPRKSDGVYADAELLGITRGGKAVDTKDVKEAAREDEAAEGAAPPVSDTAEQSASEDATTGADAADLAEQVAEEETPAVEADVAVAAGEATAADNGPSEETAMATEAVEDDRMAEGEAAPGAEEDASAFDESMGDAAEAEATGNASEVKAGDMAASDMSTGTEDEMAGEPSTPEAAEAVAGTTSDETLGADKTTEVADPEDMAEAEPTPVEEPDPLQIAAATCLEIAGPANAGVPAAAVDAASQKATLARAAEACTEAATAPDADPEVLFHAAAVAQARGAADDTFDLLTRAAQAGLGAAETRLGDYFLFGVGPDGQDVDRAVGHYQAAQEKGDAAGITTLALLYQLGRGVPRDPSRMVELMTEAADLGYHFAQYRLAQTYLTGEGIPGRASTALGIPDKAKAVRYYTMAADAGNLSAALELSDLYADPQSGLPDDPEEQVRLTRIVSSTGHPPAIARMGTFYETGRGVDYDPAVAAGLYVRAMESGKVAFDDLRTGAPAAWDRDTALEFQMILQARGLYDGALDAIVGGGTAAAARKLAE